MMRLAMRCSCSVAVFMASMAAGPAWSDEGPHAHDHPHRKHKAGEVIVVTASPLEHESDELATSVAKLDRRDIIEDAGTTLGETVSRLPGVTTTGFATGASRPVIRGQDAFRTGVVEDGLGTGDVSSLSPDHGVPINPLLAKSIEVVRGPATLRYGGGAIAGVVNTITGRVPRFMPDRDFEGEALGSWTQNAGEHQLALLLGGGVGDVAWHVDGSMLNRNDYDIPDAGNQPGSQLDAYAASAGGAWITDQGRLGFGYSRFDSEYGIPEAGEDIEIDMHANRYRMEGDLNAPFPGFDTLRTRWAITDYEHKEIAEGDTAQTFDNLEAEGRVEALHTPIGGLSGAFGLHFRHRDESFGGEAQEYLADSVTRTFAGYVFEEFTPDEHLDIQMGLRIEGTEVQGRPRGATTNRDNDFVPVSGSLGALFHPNDWLSLGLTGSVSQRAPSAPELYARGPHEATGTFELGDDDLDTETAYTGELVLRLEQGRMKAEVAHFITQYDDYVFGELQGVTVDEDGVPDPAGDLDLLQYRSRNALFYGGEVAAEARLAEFCDGEFGMKLQLDWVNARFSAGSRRNVPRVTPLRWGGGFFFHGDAFRASVSALRHERVDRTGFAESETDSFVMVDADVSYRLPLFEDHASVEVFVDGRNLANQRARNHVAFNKDEVLLPAARARIGLRGTF